MTEMLGYIVLFLVLVLAIWDSYQKQKASKKMVAHARLAVGTLHKDNAEIFQILGDHKERLEALEKGGGDHGTSD
jgi:hypothetical protein